MNIIKIIIFVLICPLLMGAALQNTTILTNPDFHQDYYINVGMTYDKGYPDLTYEMIDLTEKTGLFTSHDLTATYIQIIEVNDLPNGLTYDQYLDIKRPQNNTFYIYGTLPSDFPPGIYTVTVKGQDGKYKENTAYQTIRLHIGNSVPIPTKTAIDVVGEVGDSVTNSAVAHMNQYFKTPPGTGTLTYKLVDESKRPAGVEFNQTNGDFTGNYTQANTYVVQVQAHNDSGWSAPIVVTFYISQKDTPPVPKDEIVKFTGNVGDTVAANNMQDHFTLNPGASPIQKYRVVDMSKVPEGIGFDEIAGKFTQQYKKAGIYHDVQVQALNKLNVWSAPLSVWFDVLQPDSDPIPQKDPVYFTGITKEQVNVPNMSNYFHVNPGASSIKHYRVVDISKLPPNLSLGDDGKFTGTYELAGYYPSIEVQAKNDTDHWSDSLKVIFTVTDSDSKPFPKDPGSLDVHAYVSQDVATFNIDMASHFATNPGASAISAYSHTGLLPPALDFSADGKFHGTFTRAGTYPVPVYASNKAGRSDNPFTMNFIVDQNPPKPPATLTCPTIDQIDGCQPTATVNDSKGIAHTFHVDNCNGIYLTAFYSAQLRQNINYRQGLTCIYLDLTASPTWVYVLDPAPADMYYGNDQHNIADTCNGKSVEECPFNIPQ
jgi:hypothetical protein